MYYIPLVTDQAGTCTRFFEGGPRLEGLKGGMVELKVLGMTESREAAQAAAGDLQGRLDSQRRRQRSRRLRLVARKPPRS